MALLVTEDLKAIDAYIMRSPIRSQRQQTEKDDWRRWYTGLSWLQRNELSGKSPTMDEAQRRRELFNQAANLSTGSTPAGTAAKPVVSAGAKPTIRKGSKGEPVKEWQRVLGVTADGDFGPKTDTATRAWQKVRGLTADGIVGPATWSRAQQESQVTVNRPAPIATAAQQAVKVVQAAPKPVAATASPQVKAQQNAQAVQNVKQAATVAAKQVAAASKPPAPKPVAPKPVTGPITPASAVAKVKETASATLAQASTTVYEMPLWLKLVGGSALAAGGFVLARKTMK